MEKAVQVMEQSIGEKREDGKATPAVGAVLYMPDGSIETAYRGELRDGDHAEFTLLERKKRDEKLDGSVLFATLEPCAPGARANPKLGCAERIVLARIKEVWVGIEDPDPTVDRKGIAYLQRNGVKVNLFDRDLQEKIRTKNLDFIAQALMRADEAGKKEEAVTLTSFEEIESKADFKDFSMTALEKYRNLADLSEEVGTESFNTRLKKQGLVKEENETLAPTGYGLLLFSKNPRLTMPQAGLLATVNHANGESEKRDFDGPMVLIPEMLEEWLKGKIPKVLSRQAMKSKEQPALPFELIRESVVNALVHRDYEIEGAKCQLIVGPDSIEIMSPGSPLAPITLEQLQTFEAPMLSRNPQLHYVFSQLGFAEERGFGMKTLKSVPESLGLPIPRYRFREPYLVLSIYTNADSIASGVDRSTIDSLNAEEQEGWRFLNSKPTTTSAEYGAELGIDERKAQRHLKKFMELGLIRRMGKGRATQYKVV